MVFGIILYFIGFGVIFAIIAFLITKSFKKNSHVKNIDEISNTIKNILNVSEKTNKNKENRNLKTCSYCGGNYEGTQCSHCGAVETKK